MLRFSALLIAAAVVAAVSVDASAFSHRSSLAVLSGMPGMVIDFASDHNLTIPTSLKTGSLLNSSQPQLRVVAASGSYALQELQPVAGDVIFVPLTIALPALHESYTFKYAGPSSVPEPLLVPEHYRDARPLKGYVANISASAAANHHAGEEGFAHAYNDGSRMTVSVRSRLHTEPYFYQLNHRYCVDVIASSEVFTTRVYDEALGPGAFDTSVKGLPPGAKLYPGIVNPLGGPVEIERFAFGPSVGTPPTVHEARRSAEFMGHLGYNAAVRGAMDSITSLAFQKYFPLLLIKHVRIPADGGNYVPSINAVARYGIDADVLTSRATTISSLRGFVASLSLPPHSFELWNEPNNFFMGASYDPNYLVDLPAFARALAEAYPSVQRWGPSILPDSGNYPTVEKQLAQSLGQYITAWNTHAYARSTPENVGYGGYFAGACGASQHEDCGWYGSPNWNDNNSATINRSLPGVVTEGAGSYGTYPDILGAAGIGLAAQQAYVQRGLLYSFKLGHVETYPYKFIDDGGKFDGFGTYGILSRLRNADKTTQLITPKPAYTALVYFTHILADRAGGSATTVRRELRYGLEGASPDVEELLLSESDGSFRLVLWSDAALWNYNLSEPKTIGTDAAVVNDRVILRLGEPAGMTVFKQTPMTGTWNAGAPVRAGVSLNIDVNQYPSIVAIKPGTGGPADVDLPANVPTPGPTETPNGLR